MPSLEMPRPAPRGAEGAGAAEDDDDADMKIGDDKIARLEETTAAHAEEEMYKIDTETMMENTRMTKLMKGFTEEQNARYEAFRRSGNQMRTEVKKMMSSMCGYTVSEDTLIAVTGVTKVLVGQLVEQSLRLMNDRGIEHNGISPTILREAYQRLVDKGKVKTKVKKKCRML